MSSDPTTDPGDEPLAAGGPVPADELSAAGAAAGEEWPLVAAAAERPGIGRRVLGILLAVAISLAGAAGWTYLARETGRRYALLAVVAGILVGLAIRRVGRMSGVVAGLLAAVIAFLGAFLGEFVEGYAIQADAARVSIFEQWKQWGPSRGWDSYTRGHGLLSWLTLALAAVAAFIYGSDLGGRKKREAAAAAAAGPSVAGDPEDAAAADPDATDVTDADEAVSRSE